MGDIILVILAVVYLAGCVFFRRDRRRESQPLTEADFAELEQMIKSYQSGADWICK